MNEQEQFDNADSNPIVSEPYEIKGATKHYPSTSKCFGAHEGEQISVDLKEEIKQFAQMTDLECERLCWVYKLGIKDGRM